MRGQSNPINLTSTPDGDNHLFQEEPGDVGPTATGTSAWIAGHYAYALRVTKDSEVIQIETGSLEVLPNILDPSAEFDGRSHVKRTLDNINAVLEKRASKDQERYVIEVNGSRRELWRVPMGDLLKLRDRYQAMYNSELRARQGRKQFGPAFRTRF